MNAHDGPSNPLLWVVFAVGAAATWIAGVFLSRATDALDVRWKLGEAFGGMILLAISGSLPEVAITVSAVLAHRLDIAAGNLLGGIAIQTAVLVICDYFVTEKKPLSYLVGSLIPVLEASLVVGVTALAMLGALLPPTDVVFGASPASIAIGVLVLIVIGMVGLGRIPSQSSSGRPAPPRTTPARRQPWCCGSGAASDIRHRPVSRTSGPSPRSPCACGRIPTSCSTPRCRV